MTTSVETFAYPLPTRETPLLDAALAYVQMGFAPVPVYGVNDRGECMCGSPKCNAPDSRSKGKHPVGNGWQKRAPRTVDDARDAFSDHFGNVGLYLGDTGFVVLDFDGAAGLRTRDDLEQGGLLPRTLTARSGSGGEHRVYRLAPRHSPDAITDRRVGIGWDVKRSGQFLAAPSRHFCGGYYEWIDDAAIAELPDDLYERIRRLSVAPSSPPPPPAPSGTASAVRARAYVAKMPSAISGAGGHDATFAVARKLVQDFDLPEGDAWAILLEFNQRCEPPWSEKELRHKLQSAQKAHTRNPVPDRPREPTSGSHRTVPPAPPGGGSGGGSGSGTGGSGGGGGSDLPEPDWRVQLLYKESRTGKRQLVIHAENVIRILQLHAAWRGKIRYDEFRGRVLVRDAPWSDFTRPRECEPAWTDEDATRLAGWLRTEYHSYAFQPSITDCERAVDVVARTHGFHPVREYLEGLEWDQTFRLKTMGPTYFGADATDYTANIFRWWMISAVARIMRPGCKADHVLILEGKQGRGKSTALEILAGADWFSDSAIDLNSKDAFERVRGRWIVELAELDALFRAESSRAKQFFSSKRDDYRQAYARREREQLRQCVFAGSVNEGVYLKDPTGARRFWPVLCRLLALEALRRDRDQLWAEALWYYREGAAWWPDAPDLADLEEQQEARTEQDDWREKIAAYLSKNALDSVGTADLLEHALKLEPKDWTRATQTRVGSIMSHGFQWAKRKVTVHGLRVWRYERSGQP